MHNYCVNRKIVSTEIRAMIYTCKTQETLSSEDLLTFILSVMSDEVQKYRNYLKFSNYYQFKNWIFQISICIFWFRHKDQKLLRRQYSQFGSVSCIKKPNVFEKVRQKTCNVSFHLKIRFHMRFLGFRLAHNDFSTQMQTWLSNRHFYRMRIMFQWEKLCYIVKVCARSEKFSWLA